MILSLSRSLSLSHSLHLDSDRRNDLPFFIFSLHYSFSRFTFAENKGAAEAAEEENKKCWLSEWSRSVGRIEMKRWQKNIISLARLFKPKIQGPNNGPMAEFEKKIFYFVKAL
jgi:hypothetical protein